MRSSKASPWVIGTAVLVAALLAASWFLLVSPAFAQAAETNTTAEQVEADNALREQRISILAEQFANIETYRSELATLRASVPTDDDLAAYLRELTAAAEAHAVTLLSVTPSTPAAFVVAAPEPAATPAADGAASAAADDAATTQAAAPTTSAIADGTVSIPLTLSVVGTFDNVRAFLATLQTGTQRLLVVESVTGTSQPDAVAGGGRPATTLGDLEIMVSGALFVLPDDATTPPAPTEETPQAPLPAAPEGKNPLV
ncbi:hypothetical protein, partial [Cellulomonas biazotea]